MKKIVFLCALILSNSFVSAGNIKILETKHSLPGVARYNAFVINYTKEHFTSIKIFCEPVDSVLIFYTLAGKPRFNIKAEILGSSIVTALDPYQAGLYQGNIGHTFGYDINKIKDSETLDLQITFGQETFYVRLIIKNKTLTLTKEITKEEVGKLGGEEFDSADTEPFEYREYGRRGTESDDEDGDILENEAPHRHASCASDEESTSIDPDNRLRRIASTFVINPVYYSHDSQHREGQFYRIRETTEEN